MSRLLVLVPLVCVLGCGGGLNYDSNVELNEGESRIFDIDPAKSVKTMKVQVTGGPVSISVYLKDAPAKAVASMENTVNPGLEAQIPANKAAEVRLSSPKRITVRLKMTN